ncbi:MAG TPA: hypothetical protein VN066_05080 [Rhodocyclaceae bacterium]|nr:hypothetical protein [Rhodocyclaceae bacterium]
MLFSSGRGLSLRLADGFGRFVVSGGQLILLFIGFQIDDPRGWFFIAAGIAALSIFGWLAALHRWRSISDTPTSQVATAAQGYVELIGRGKPLDGLPLVSPLTALPCLWYRYNVEVKDGEGRWKHDRSETSDASFIISDGTGECLVDPDGAEVLSIRKDVWTQGDERYTQWLLLKDERIYVLGQFMTRTGLDLQLDRNEDIKDLLAEWKRDHPQLLKRFDLDGDGALSLKEWELARSAARREVEARHREVRSSADLHLMHYPEDGRLYMISNMAPDKLARRYQWWAWGHLFIFFGGLAGASYSYLWVF